jgi:hypothetical protein
MINNIVSRTFLEPKILLKADVIIDSGISELDDIVGGFKSGEITYIEGDSHIVSEIPYRICVNSYCNLKSDIIFLDGGNICDPYRISKIARISNFYNNDVLDHVIISRAFTLYQLSNFIEFFLEYEIKKHDTISLVIANFPRLYQDPDVDQMESRVILKNNLVKLQELTSDYNLITVISNYESNLWKNIIRNNIHLFSNEVIQMKYKDSCTHVKLKRKNKTVTILNDYENQIRLENYGMVV